MNKKGMDANQAFLYIAAVIIVGLVFVFGVRAIFSLQDSAENIQKVSFVRDFEADITKISTEFRAIKVVDLKIPSRYSEVCIIDLSKTPPASGLQPLILAEWSDAQSALLSGQEYDMKNFFLLSDNTLEESFYVPKIVIENPGYLCVSGNAVSLTLTGQGSTTLVAETPSN
jgi:hypothetical protein